MMRGFAIPDELRDQPVSPGGEALIRALFASHRGFGPVIACRGQLLFADWIMADPAERERAFDGCGFLSGELIDRILCGEVEPGETGAAVIAEVTEDAVPMEAWGMTPRTIATLAAQRAAAPLVSQGRLGEVPPGRLWWAVRDDREPSVVQVVGPGLTLRLEEASFRGLRAAIEAVPA